MNPKIRNNLIAVIVLEVIFLGGQFWLFRGNQILSDKIIAQETSARELELKVLSYDNIKEEYSKLGNEGEGIRKKFVNFENPVDYIQLIEKAAQESGVKLEIQIYTQVNKEESKKDKEKSKESKDKKEEIVTLSLNTESNFNSFMHFLIKLENLEKYCEIKEVELKKDIIKRKDMAPDGETSEVVEEAVIKGKIIIYSK